MQWRRRAEPEQAREALDNAVESCVEDEVDAALAVQQHILVSVPCHGLEAHALEHPAHGHRVGRGVFDEFKPVCAHGVVLCCGVIQGSAWAVLLS